MWSEERPYIKILHSSVAVQEVLSGTLAKAHQKTTPRIEAGGTMAKERVQIGIGELG
jgi:hypothetical protein